MAVRSSEHEHFTLLWTVGFAGKRQIPLEREPIIANALSRTLDFLDKRAEHQAASLTAVSSIARGGDVIFAELALGKTNHRSAWHWKCVLPFRRDDFFETDLSDLDGSARESARRRAIECIESSGIAPIVTTPETDMKAREQREQAYLDCGYRVVDEADVIIVLLNQQEMADFENTLQTRPYLAGPGSAAVARYAHAARRPLILLDADATDPWDTKRIFNDPDQSGEAFFFDPQVTRLVKQCVEQHASDAAITLKEHVPYTPRMRAAARLHDALGALADAHQSSTVTSLRRVLTLHLIASGIAALLATMAKEVTDGAEESWPRYLPHALWCLAVVAAIKPALAAAAFFVERRLHHHGIRETWTQARALAELCRGGLAMWPLPQQPLDAQDEEDFPRVKRLLRTLRLMREQDTDAVVPSKPLRQETQAEADMRTACDGYIANRLDDQIGYYGDKKEQAVRQGRRWRRAFLVATWAVMVLGVLLLLPKLEHAWTEAVKAFVVIEALAPLARGLGALLSPVWTVAHNLDTVSHPLEAALIIAPFVAAYSLATMSLLDCRRRERRYAEMVSFLDRMRDTLRRTESNPSRLRLIEHAERSLIEEQHEWFSVMRNLNV